MTYRMVTIDTYLPQTRATGQYFWNVNLIWTSYLPTRLRCKLVTNDCSHFVIYQIGRLRKINVPQIQAIQSDNPLKYDTAKVEIELIDINDNLPQFEVDVYNISIVENLPNGFSVLQVVAADQDQVSREGQHFTTLWIFSRRTEKEKQETEIREKKIVFVTQGENADFVYHLVDPSQAFNIDAKTGWLSVRNQAKLDREQRSTLSMRVYAREKVPSVIAKVTDVR